MITAGVPPSTDNSGSFFCTAFLENTPGITENINSGRRMLYITTDEPTPVPFTVQFGNLPLLGMPPVPSVTGTATAGQYTQVTAPPIVELGVGTGSIPRLVHAVQITSTGGDIQVYAVHDDERSSDGWLVLPQVVHPDVSTYRYATFSSLLDAGQLSRNTIFATTSCFTNRFTISLNEKTGTWTAIFQHRESATQRTASQRLVGLYTAILWLVRNKLVHIITDTVTTKLKGVTDYSFSRGAPLYCTH